MRLPEQVPVLLLERALVLALMEEVIAEVAAAPYLLLEIHCVAAVGVVHLPLEIRYEAVAVVVVHLLLEMHFDLVVGVSP